MKFFAQIKNDFIGILKVCGFLTAIKWLGFILLKIFQCIKSKNLQPADRMFGEGPIKVKSNKFHVNLIGGQIFSNIREIWVRNVYLKDDFLNMPDEGVIVDLGANVGAFTILALANSNNGKVISVEPNSEFNELFNRQIKLNNLEDRVTLLRYFIGSFSDKQKEMLKNPYTSDAKFISQKDFIDLFNFNKIDFLKCDIEGSEFDFIKDTSLLSLTKQLAVEIHDFSGDRYYFLDQLKKLGFSIGPVKHDSCSCIALAKKND